MKATILITGGSGYLGQNLIARLKKFKSLKLLLLQNSKSPENYKSNSKLKYFYYDLPKFGLSKILTREKPDLVIHLAGFFVGEHQPKDIDNLINSNISFGTKLLDSMKDAGVKKFINTGTYWEEFYQNGEYHPVNLYAALKKSFEDIMSYYVELHQFRTITLKLFDIYGPNDNRKKIMSLLLNHLGKINKLPMSPSDQYVDFIYIDDVVFAYIKAIDMILKKKEPLNETVDIGSGKSIKLKNLILLIKKVFNKKLNVSFGARPYRLREVMKAKANLKKTKKILNWQPKYSVENGLNIIKRINI